ncbi:MAG: tyrosine--tRNA ligase, partial [Clostridia bacterium]|nr:tyrosine--tRNA ligase [Clostridia bacterium]
PEKTSPYDFFQYWRNVGDADVIKCMKMLTFMPLEEIAEYEKLEGGELNRAKEKLAFEMTQLVHGTEEAQKAFDAAKSVFGGAGDNANMPTVTVEASALSAEGTASVADLLVLGAMAPSKGEAKRLIQQGGIFCGDNKIERFDAVLTADQLKEGIVIRKGKKTFKKFILG